MNRVEKVGTIFRTTAILLFSVLLLILVVVELRHSAATHHDARSRHVKSAYVTRDHQAGRDANGQGTGSNQHHTKQSSASTSIAHTTKSEPSPTAPIPPDGTLVQLPSQIQSIVVGVAGPSSQLQYCSPEAAPLVAPIPKEKDFYLCVLRATTGLVEVQLGWVQNTPVASLVPKGTG